ncbi:GXWXG protein [Micromonospora haikouensis]|uniref:GXWXG protein n=1 Tax=Micromonospora haikouensis TaxID=686309 RepID=A0A1C4V825_9ACTN|nr:DUF4334 domain-containing protein [Micromonospora haikouensis]SCE80102.1 GXWXG protein [Micromonospora haikouensis]
MSSAADPAPAAALPAPEHPAALPAPGDLATALACFDGLPPVTVGEMLGSWRGSGFATGHPLDGLLERYGWHGKRFDGPEDVHPLVFAAGGRLVSVNPALVPTGLLLRPPGAARTPLAARAFALALPLLTTTRPAARLRMTEYRGVVSATMCYDRLPIHDVFRRVDERTLLGVMDLRGTDRPFVFVLRRPTTQAGG